MPILASPSIATAGCALIWPKRSCTVNPAAAIASRASTQLADLDLNVELDDDSNRLMDFPICRDDSQELATWWDALRVPLMGARVTAFPGSRPWAFWRFDAPKEPLRLAAGRVWRDDERTVAHRRRPRSCRAAAVIDTADIDD